jgi:alanine racemase
MSLRSKLNRRLQRLEKPFAAFNEITVSRSAVLSNFDFFASLTASGHVIPVLKANAYGHGITEIATILKARNFPYIAVDGFYESLAIHEVSRQPVLVMGAIKPANFKRMSFRGIAFAVSDSATVVALGATKRKVTVHIELETGMTRHGVSAKDLPKFLELAAKFPNLQVEGVMTHLADADNATDATYNELQTKRFDDAVDNILAAGFKPKYFHIAQSAGSTKIVSKYANALRVGIAFYGVNPLKPSDQSYALIDALKPVLTLTTSITRVQEIEPGTTVSYSRTFTAKEPARIGVLPLGYYEGVPRALSNVGLVQHGDQYLQIAGKVCMNHVMIDLRDSNATIGDIVTIISSDKASKLTVNAICKQHDLFSYGVLVGLNQNIRRRIVA